AEGFDGGGEGVAVEDGVDALHHVGGDFQEVAFVLGGDEGAAGAVVHGDLERFRESAHRLDVALDAEVAEHQEGRQDGALAKSGVDGDHQPHADLAGDVIGKEIDGLHVDVGGGEGLRDAELYL